MTISVATTTTVICDQCQQEIHDGQDRFTGIAGRAIVDGEIVASFTELDFCSTEHLLTWLSTAPTIAVPTPPPAG